MQFTIFENSGPVEAGFGPPAPEDVPKTASTDSTDFPEFPDEPQMKSVQYRPTADSSFSIPFHLLIGIRHFSDCCSISQSQRAG
jgi:hypothetical protein